MAHIQNLFVCPRCENGITSIKTTTSCPECSLPLGNMEIPSYSTPWSFTEQHEKFQDKELYLKTLMDLPITKVNSILNDALSVMEVIAGKKTQVSDMRTVMEIGMRIGEIAKAYDAFLQAGGKHVPGFFIKSTPQPGDTNDNSETTGSSQQASTSSANDASPRLGSVSESGGGYR